MPEFLEFQVEVIFGTLFRLNLNALLWAQAILRKSIDEKSNLKRCEIEMRRKNYAVHFRHLTCKTLGKFGCHLTLFEVLQVI